MAKQPGAVARRKLVYGDNLQHLWPGGSLVRAEGIDGEEVGMTIQSLRRTVSKDVLALSPELLDINHVPDPYAVPVSPYTVTAKRIIQDVRVYDSKLELDFHRLLQIGCQWLGEPITHLRVHAYRWRMAGGVHYTPDFTALVGGVPTAWEVKGPHKSKGVAKGLATAKIFAGEFTEWTVWLVWRVNYEWEWQRILSDNFAI